MDVNESPLLGLSNLRAALQAFQLRDNLKRCGSELRWLASDYDLADALTKKRSECRLKIAAVSLSGHFCLIPLSQQPIVTHVLASLLWIDLAL